MDEIYSGAQLTIVAAAGTDERHGLCGVSALRKPTTALRMGDFTITEIPNDAFGHSSSTSRWVTRGRTCQEDILSYRRMQFLKDQVSFSCCKMHCHEDLSGPESAQDEDDLRVYNRGIIHFLDKRNDTFSRKPGTHRQLLRLGSKHRINTLNAFPTIPTVNLHTCQTVCALCLVSCKPLKRERPKAFTCKVFRCIFPQLLHLRVDR